MKNNLKTAKCTRRTSCFNDIKISSLLKKDLLKEKRDEDLEIRKDIKKLQLKLACIINGRVK